MAEKDLVWEELELDDLLDLGRQSIAAQQLEAEARKSKAIMKQQKLMQKPGFNVLMDRYSSLPSKPKAISMSKLNQLADPIIGRLTQADKRKYENVVKRKTGGSRMEMEDPRVRKIVLSINEEEGDVRYSNLPPPRMKAPAGDGFFMTEAIAEEDESLGSGGGRPLPRKSKDPQGSRIQTNIKSSKNGFASMLRNRVHDAKKVSKLSKPLDLYKGRSDDLDESVKRDELTNAYKQRLDKLKKANKEIYERNKVALKKAKDKRMALGLDSSMSDTSLNGKAKRVGVLRDPKTGRIKKVSSSGYGKQVQRFSNQPKVRSSAPLALTPAAAAAAGGFASNDLLLTRSPQFITCKQPRMPKKTKAIPTNDEQVSIDQQVHDGSISDITPASSLPKSSLTQQPPAQSKRAQQQQHATRSSSLAAIKEDPEERKPSLSKNLSSSSAPHLARKSKSKLPSMATKTGQTETTTNPADASNNGPTDKTRRTIRSAGALRISKDESETAEVLMRVVEAKRKSNADHAASTTEVSSSSPRKTTKSTTTTSTTAVGAAAIGSSDTHAQMSSSKASPSSLSPPRNLSKLQPVPEESPFAAATLLMSPPLLPATLSTSPIKPTAIPISPAKMADQELQVMESNIRDLLKRDQSKITDDIAMSIQKLQQFEKAIVNGDMYCKPDVNSTLARRAEKLGGHLTAAESILAEYEAMKDF